MLGIMSGDRNFFLLVQGARIGRGIKENEGRTE